MAIGVRAFIIFCKDYEHFIYGIYYILLLYKSYGIKFYILLSILDISYIYFFIDVLFKQYYFFIEKYYGLLPCKIFYHFLSA